MYMVRNKHNMGEVLFEYQGDFENGEFAGDSLIKTTNGKHQIETNFRGDFIKVKSLETPDFQF